MKLYSSKQEEYFGREDAVVDDVVDFPLGPNGDLDFERVKLWWGINICAVRHFEEGKAHSFLLWIDNNIANKHRLLCCPRLRH